MARNDQSKRTGYCSSSRLPRILRNPMNLFALFIEKPIGISQPQATDIISKTQEVGGTVLVGQYDSCLINKANTLIAEGLIGELQRIDFTRITTRP